MMLKFQVSRLQLMSGGVRFKSGRPDKRQTTVKKKQKREAKQQQKTKLKLKVRQT